MEGQVQKDIQRLDAGGSAFIYAVTSEVVLKAPAIYCLRPDASSEDRYLFATETFFSHDDIRIERGIHSLLETAPHPNVIQPIVSEYAEGIYLPRSQPLALSLKKELPPAITRKCLYRDMLSALRHLHKFEIAHADVRIDNFLQKEGGPVVLCDFTCSRPFGEADPSFAVPPETVARNGPYSQVSDVTDRFALASVIYEIETGRRPALSFDGTDLKVPSILTGDAQLDVIIRKAWFNDFTSTLEMLQAMENLLPYEKLFPVYDVMDSSSIQKLRAQIDEWRVSRQHRYGTRFSSQNAFALHFCSLSLLGEVLFGICNEETLQNFKKTFACQ